MKSTIPEGDENGNYTVRSGWAQDFLTLRIDNRHIGGYSGQQDDEELGDAMKPIAEARKEVGDNIQIAI